MFPVRTRCQISKHLTPHASHAVQRAENLRLPRLTADQHCRGHVDRERQDSARIGKETIREEHLRLPASVRTLIYAGQRFDSES